MSATPPPQGQIDGPNPLELFWEQHKSKAYVLLTLFALAVAGSYGWQYLQKRQRDAAWQELATAGALDQAYAEAGDDFSMLESLNENNAGYMVQFYLSQRTQGLAADLVKDLEKADSSELQKIAAAGDSRSPLALWLLAGRAIAVRDWDAALARLGEIETRFPDHFLVASSAYPVQWRPEVPKTKEEKQKEKEEAKDPMRNRRRDEERDLVPAQSGSAVSELRASIERERSFESEHVAFYQAPEPTSAETVTFEIENAGTIKIKLYPDRAPAHVARFLELARSGYWQGQRIHEIQRSVQRVAAEQSEMQFGWSSTTSDDRSKWEPGEVADENKVVWEDSGLSHFPGMVAAVQMPILDDKSQAERIVINAKDVSKLHDGSRVIFGRVVEGLDVVETIVGSGFIDDTALNLGRGAPEELFTIKSVTVE